MPTESERATAFRRERAAQQRYKIRLFTDVRGEILRLLATAQDSILARIATASIDGDTFSLLQLRGLEESIRLAMESFAINASSVMSASLTDIWAAGIAMVDEPLRAAGIQLAAVAPSIDPRQLEAMRAFTTDRIRGISIDIADKINRELGLSMIGAQNFSETVTKVQRIVGKGGRSRAIGIVRTELGRAYSTATQERLEMAQDHVPGLQKQWRRSGKVHSRLAHDAIDGQVRDIDEQYTIWNGRNINLRYPRDPRAPIGETIHCGCDSLPYKEDWEVRNKGKKPFDSYDLQEKKGDDVSDDIKDKRRLAAGESIRNII